MPSRKPSTLHHIHIYFVSSDCFVVPANYLPKNGMWMESLPIVQVDKTDLDALATAIQQAKENSSTGNPNPVAWDGQSGQVWRKASAYWTVRWLSDGTISVTPQQEVSIKTDPGTGEILDGGWKPDKNRRTILSGSVPFRVIAEALTK